MADVYLDHAVEREKDADWAAARAAVWQAKALADDRGTLRVRRRALDAQRDLELADALAAIRSDRADATRPHFNTADVDRQYQEALRKFGLGTLNEPPAAVAARIRLSPVHTAIVAALDDWAFCFNNESRRLWLLEVARGADPDPWRDRVRDAANWHDLKVLNELAAGADLRRESVPLLSVLGGLLDVNQGDGVSFFRHIQAAHPDDFWANFVLAEYLDERGDADAVSFYRVALALRPNSTAANVNLAMSLQKRGRGGEATDYWKRALELAPGAPMVHRSIAIALMNDGQTDQAIGEFRQTLRLDPDFPHAHAGLGHALLAKGRLVEAKLELRRAMEQSTPDDPVRAQVTQDLADAADGNGPDQRGQD
jgi:serine/threonine-protein kinase